MTRLVRFSNNAVSQLAANLLIGGTSLSVTPGDGSKFPSLSAGQYFMATLVKADGSTEVVKVTARSTDTFTIVRAAEPVAGASTAYAFSAGDRIEARLTAGVLGNEIDRLDASAIIGVLNKSANYTVLEADVTSLIRVDTSGGTRTITLPEISSLTADFDIIIDKVTSDLNAVTIARQGSDTINGGTLYTLTAQYQSAWVVADRSTNTWSVIQSNSNGVGVNAIVDEGTGSGSATLTLSVDPGSINNVDVVVGGVPQLTSSMSLSGTTLTVGGAIAAGVKWMAKYNVPLSIGTPADGTVTTAKLADGALAATVAGLAKMADGFLQATTAGLAKMADGFLAATTTGRAKMADGFVTPAKMANSGAEFGLRNRIINGAMMIDQRNAGASVTVNTGNQTFSVDRWWGQGTASSGVFTMQQSSVAPTGFANSLLMTVTTADASLAATDLYDISQVIEGFNVADLGWGTANAATVTLSFWVRSSVTGTFGGSFGNSDVNRSYPFTYSINLANTWEQKSVTIAGDTIGTWLKTNGVGLRLYLGLGMGSTYSGTAGSWASAFYISATGATNLMATNGATFYITGVQLEKGSTATSFDYRPYGTELALCQRYYEVGTMTWFSFWGAAGILNGGSRPFKATKRATPTITATNTVASNCSATPNVNTITVEDFGNYHASTSGLGIQWADTWTAAAEL